jgi:GAF domain-containing protein
VNERLNRLFTLSAYTDPLTRNRAISTYIISSLIIVFTLLFFGTLLSIVSNAGHLSTTTALAMLITAGALEIAGVSAIALTRNGRQSTAGRLILVMWVFVIGYGLTQTGYPPDGLSWSIILFLWVGLPLTVLLAGTDLLPLAGILALGGVIVFAVRIQPPDDQSQPYNFVLTLVLLLGVILAAQIGVSWLLGRGQDMAAQRANIDAAKRLGLVEASAGVMQRILSRLDLDSLLSETVTLVRDTFNEIDGVQLWLVDNDRRNAGLVASTRKDSPDAPQQTVGVGSLNAVGRVTITGQSQLIRDTPTEQTYRRSALPSGIRSVLVLPLKIATEVSGALEVQSARLDAFTKDDVDVLEALSDQIAIAIDNARLYASTQASLAENRRLYEQTRSSLREIERLNQQLTGQAWNEYLRTRSAAPALTIDMSSGQVDSFAEWTPTLDEASRTRAVVSHTTPTGGKIVALPITVHGQVIGAMEFEMNADQSIAPEQLTVVQQVIERMGLSADNARLFDEAQRIAQREATVNAASVQMQGASNVETVLSTATRTLAEMFGSSRVAVRLGNVPRSPDGESQ